MSVDNDSFPDIVKQDPDNEMSYKELLLGKSKNIDICEMCGNKITEFESRRTVTEVVFSGNTSRINIKFYHIGGCFGQSSD